MTSGILLISAMKTNYVQKKNCADLDEYNEFLLEQYNKKEFDRYILEEGSSWSSQNKSVQ